MLQDFPINIFNLCLFAWCELSKIQKEERDLFFSKKIILEIKNLKSIGRGYI